MHLSVVSLPAARNRAHGVREERRALPGWNTRQQSALRYTETGKGLASLPRACDTSGQTSAWRALTGLFLIALHVGSSHTSLNLLLFQKPHQAQLLKKEEMQ